MLGGVGMRDRSGVEVCVGVWVKLEVELGFGLSRVWVGSWRGVTIWVRVGVKIRVGLGFELGLLLVLA